MVPRFPVRGNNHLGRQLGFEPPPPNLEGARRDEFEIIQVGVNRKYSHFALFPDGTVVGNSRFWCA